MTSAQADATMRSMQLVWMFVLDAALLLASMAMLWRGADFFVDVLTEATFDGTRSSDSDGYLVSYFWEMADENWVAGRSDDLARCLAILRAISAVLMSSKVDCAWK